MEKASQSQGPGRSCDGQELKRLLEAGTAWLERNAKAINALNVFPVPDGDTGTNMLLTMQAALAEIADSPEHSASVIAHAVAHGSLMGARGNSGVILSQLLRGFARALDKKETFNGADFAVAMQEGSDTAYKGVIKPVEGTILTVGREAAEAAAVAARESDDLLYVLERTVAAARESVARTPTLLDVLAEAGVVDAGGQGLFVILEGALRFLKGEPMEVVMPAEMAVAKVSPGPIHEEMQYGYCTEFILQGQNLNYEEVREKITAMGDSALVVGDDYLIRVHVHTFHPGQVLEYATSKGILRKIKIDNMQDQHRDFLSLPLEEERKPPAPVEELSDIGIVAVAPGPGLSRVFESLGASAIVPGGQTMNPSTEELLQAIESLTTDNVIVLPNNKNIILTAQQARELTSKQVIIVPTKTVPQGISALLAFNYQADLETNARSMERAMEHIQTAEITWAVRSAQVNGVEVAEGEIIGLLNGNLTASGHHVDEVALEMLRQMEASQYEIITVYFGQDVSQEQAEALAEKIQAAYPEQEVEVIDGGQPHYHYILSAE
ncbi:MAG: DAK2 domain-containing protein [Anaerolineae bacterium]